MYVNFSKISRFTISLVLAVIFFLSGIAFILLGVINWTRTSFFFLFLSIALILEAISNVLLAIKIKKYGEINAYIFKAPESVDNKKAFVVISLFTGGLTVAAIISIIASFILLIVI